MSYQKFTKDILIIGSANLLIALSGFIFLPLITKLLGPENYGIWAQVMVTITFLTPVATLGLPYTLVRFLAAKKDKKEIQEELSSVLAVVCAASFSVALIILFLAEPISKIIIGQQNLLRVLAFIIIVECLNLTLLNLFRAFQQIKKYSFFILFQAFGEVGLVSFTIYLGYGILGAVFSLLIIRLIILLILLVNISRNIGFKIPKFLEIKKYLSFSLPTVSSNTSYWIIQSSDRYLIGFFWGTLLVGYYAPSYVIANVLNLFIFPLSFLLPAVLSKLFDENKINEVKTYLKYSIKYFLMMAIPSFIGLSLLSKQLLIIFSTPEISEHSYFITPFIILSNLLFGVYAIVVQIISLAKKTKIIGTIWTISAFINLGLNIYIIPKIGILGAAITTIVSYTLAFLLILYFSLKELKFDIDWQFVLKSIVASFLMGFVIFLLNPTGLLNVLLTIACGTAIYGILIFLLRCIKKEEILFFLRILKK